MNCPKCNGSMVGALHEDMLEGAEKRAHQRIAAQRCQACGYVHNPGTGVQLTEQGRRNLLTERRS